MENHEEFHHLLKVDPDLCIGCAHCIRRCPNKALRIRDGKATLRKDWCIDCGECLKVCQTSAIYVEQDDFDSILNYECRVVLFPASFLAQFPEKHSQNEIISALYSLGFSHVYPVGVTVDVIHELISEQINAKEQRPLISSYCPAIIRLIQTKFTDLIDNILNIPTPFETTALLYRRRLLEQGYKDEDIGIVYVTP